MSIACFECKGGEAFNTLILFCPDGVFDHNKETAEYANFYTDCAKVTDFEAAAHSRFMIVEKPQRDVMWSRASPCLIRDAKPRLIYEAALARKLPNIFAALPKMRMPVD